jgi:hypothetical protein
VNHAAKANHLPLMGLALDESQLKMRLSQGWTILLTGADVLALVGRQAALLAQARRTVDQFSAEMTKRIVQDDAHGRLPRRGDAKL